MQQASSPRALPRGIRNHNPGNIRRDGKPPPWRGLAKDQADPAFLIFDAPLWGLRALARTLFTYYFKYNLRTPRAIITRYAPPVENDTGAYVAQVADWMGVRPDAEIDTSLETWVKLMQGIVRHENGVGAYYPSDLYWEAAQKGRPEAKPEKSK